MRTADGQQYGFFRAIGNFVKNGGTGLVVKTIGVGALGGIAGIGLRAGFKAYVDGVYSGDLVYQFLQGVKEVTPFVDGRDNLTDVTKTLSAAAVAAGIYFGGKLIKYIHEKGTGHYASSVAEAADYAQQQAPFRALQQRTNLEAATIAVEEDLGLKKAASRRRLRDLGAI
ncbi:MAG: hypothetical protein AABW51_05130 [Nanoarchaeota archaeon]